jgi:hypothetical protein
VLTSGKLSATNETAAIWDKVVAQAERLRPENLEMLACFQAERRDLDTAGTRLQRALEYLWQNERPRSSDTNRRHYDARDECSWWRGDKCSGILHALSA